VIPPPARGWLVDTNVISELRKGSRCSWAVRAWSERVPPVACFISRISLAEIRFGIDRVTDPAFRAELDAWVQDGVLPWFGTRVLEVDESVLLRWRHLVAEGRKSNYTYAQPDVLLAATALVHQLGVATRNGEDFIRSGVRIINPWDPPV
jgi:predicted nucleic acid-binding protein